MIEIDSILNIANLSAMQKTGKKGTDIAAVEILTIKDNAKIILQCSFSTQHFRLKISIT